MNYMRHAYLIMAHKNFAQVSKMISVLDDYQNDIYIHFDIKMGEVPPNFSEESLCQSRLIIIPQRLNLTWGGWTLIEAELLLLQTALTGGNYGYLHLLSGQDLPIKSQNYIRAFFEEHYGKEFVSFDSDACQTGDFIDRVSLYHPFADTLGRNRGPLMIALRAVNKLTILGQRLAGVDRTKSECVTYYKGDQWFSITSELARYVVARSDVILSRYRYTSCADEIFLQTLVMQSPFSNKVANQRTRLIDWTRGRDSSPHTYRKEDFKQIIASDRLFARKFDSNIDEEIIDMVVDLASN